MKYFKLTLAMTAVFGLCVGLAPLVWAGGAGGGIQQASCQVENPGGGALMLKGTATVINDASEEVPTAEVTIRLERSGVLRFYRLLLPKNSVADLTNEEIACRFLNPEDTNDPYTIAAVNAFVDNILSEFFGLSSEYYKLVITRKSITNTDGPVGDEIPAWNPDLDPPDFEGTYRWSSVSDILIYAVEK